MYEEQKYEHTINQIMVQFENLIMDIILTSIKRLNENYDQVFIKATNKKQVDDMIL
jgi:DNA-binding protein